ncbi:MAG: hypothetical protein RLZ98_2055 [Pseudomonadota bacterium]|jgi:hypothetical protein
MNEHSGIGRSAGWFDSRRRGWRRLYFAERKNKTIAAGVVLFLICLPTALLLAQGQLRKNPAFRLAAIQSTHVAFAAIDYVASRAPVVGSQISRVTAGASHFILESIAAHGLDDGLRLAYAAALRRVARGRAGNGDLGDLESVTEKVTALVAESFAWQLSREPATIAKALGLSEPLPNDMAGNEKAGGAVRWIESDLGIMEALSAADPGNVFWWWKLSDTERRASAAASAAGRLEEALGWAARRYRRLATLNASNAASGFLASEQSDALRQVASTLILLGRNDEARPMLEDVMRIEGTASAANSRSAQATKDRTAQTLQLIGLAHIRQGRGESAVGPLAFVATLRQDRQSNSAERCRALQETARNNELLGDAMVQKGTLRSAHQKYMQALSPDKKLYGTLLACQGFNHDLHKRVMLKLAKLYAAANMPVESRRILVAVTGGGIDGAGVLTPALR